MILDTLFRASHYVIVGSLLFFCGWVSGTVYAQPTNSLSPAEAYRIETELLHERIWGNVKRTSTGTSPATGPAEQAADLRHAGTNDHDS